MASAVNRRSRNLSSHDIPANTTEQSDGDKRIQNLKPLKIAQYPWEGRYQSLCHAGKKWFGRLWLPQYTGLSIYPGIIPHKSASGWMSIFKGYSTSIFEKKIGVFEGHQESRMIQDTGIREFTEKNGGISSFWIAGFIPVIYVTDHEKSIQLSRGHYSRIPLNEGLSGVSEESVEVLLTTPNRNLALGQLMTSANLVEMAKKSCITAQKFLHEISDKNLSSFLHEYVEHVESMVLLNFENKPLPSYTQTIEGRSILHNFLETIINITLTSEEQKPLARKYEQAAKEMIFDNFDPIQANPANVFKKLYQIANVDFPKTREEIGSQGEAEKAVLKQCLGIVAGASVNTFNALWRVIGHIETNEEIKKKVVAEAQEASLKFDNFGELEKQLNYTLTVVLESLRFTPIVPGLGKVVRKAHTVNMNGKEVPLDVNTFILVDIWSCNRTNPNFKDPHSFNPENIDLTEGLMKFISKNAFRTFGGGHEPSATSMCPGRKFSVVLQALLIVYLYKHFTVETKDVSLRSVNKSSFQFHMLPEDKGTISLKRKQN